jgi:SHAQKYF class myb-like DNA-binding protein
LKNGRWTRDEHFRFLEALKLYGKEWKRVQEHVASRTSTQARSHAQKFFVKLEKRNLSLEAYLESMDVNDIGKSLIFSDLDDDDSDNSSKLAGDGAKKALSEVPEVVEQSNCNLT